jgi:antitoxin MazE
MLTKVQKWGNSLALRIPKTFAAEAGLEIETLVDMSYADGQIVIKAVPPPVWTREGLLAGITDQNIHHEAGIGFLVGKEGG